MGFHEWQQGDYQGANEVGIISRIRRLTRALYFLPPLVLILGSFLPSETVVADWQPSDGHKMHYPQLPDEEGWDVNATQPNILADDWRCSQTGVITDIHFWGSWRDMNGDGVGDVGQIRHFVISIHEDIPAGQDPLVPWSHPGLTLREWEISQFGVVSIDPPSLEAWFDPATGTVVPNDHRAYFQYNMTNLDTIVPNPFTQIEGTIYWLNISAVLVDPLGTQWGWKSSRDHFNDDAVWALWGALNWTEMYEPPRFNRFDARMGPANQLLGGGGTNFFGNGWYEYPQSGWWNIWFYDNPFTFDHSKDIQLSFDVEVIDPANFVEIAVNWSTPEWSFEGNPPGMPRQPPIPPVDETLYIGRQPFVAGPLPVGIQHFDIPFQLPNFNPEWVSIDIRGENFSITNGQINHVCVGTSLDLAFVITGGCKCDADVNGDGILNIADFVQFISCFGAPPIGFCASSDINCDGAIDMQDFIAIHCQWYGRPPNYCCAPIVGACCLPSQACRQLTAADCALQSGTYYGDGSACGNGQTLDPEACCYPDGSCAMADPFCCEQAGGTAQGQGTVCTQTEACCLPGGICRDVDPLCCDDLGGVSQGAGTDCTIPGICLTLCPVPSDQTWCQSLQTRDCQNPTAVDSCLPRVVIFPGPTSGPIIELCDCLSPSDCGAVDIRPSGPNFVVSCPGPCPPGLDCQLHYNGTPTGRQSTTSDLIPPNTTVTCACAAVPPEACCLPDGTCVNTTPANCQSQGGQSQGPGTQCSQPQACCLPGGVCRNVDPLCCDDLGGTPQGPGTVCTANIACCLPNGQCADVDPLCCDDIGGSPSPTGASACAGDLNGNGVDDACEVIIVQACCLPNGTCTEVEYNRCVALGGDPQGPNTVCDLRVCRPIKWAQPPTYGPNLIAPPPCFRGWDEPSSFVTGPIVADDWACETNQPVTDIHWWGSYRGWTTQSPPPIGPGFPDTFHIGIWTDVPVNVDRPFSHPGTMIREWFVPRAELNERYFGCDTYPGQPQDTCFRYDFEIPPGQWFHQAPAPNATIYWIAISAMYPAFCACDGDVDGDGQVDLADVTRVVQCMQGQPVDCTKADANCDGSINQGDADAAVCLFQGGTPEQCCPGAGVAPEFPWGWKTREHFFNDDGVRILVPPAPGIGADFLDGVPIETADGKSWDLAFVLTTRAKAGLKWEQWPSQNLPGLHAHDGIRLADNWECRGGRVTDLHWWGNYERDPFGQEIRGGGIQCINLSIHRNRPVLPWCLPEEPADWGVCALFDPLNERDTGLTNNEGSKIYLYDFYLPDGFAQTIGEVYWLDIEAQSNNPQDPALWRWQENKRDSVPRICPAAQRSMPPPPFVWSSIEWPPIPPDPPRYSEMAFRVTSRPYPPDSDPTGVDKTRFISFAPGNPGEQTALMVRLTSLHHPNPPYTGGAAADFTAFEGEVLWVGPPAQYIESASSGVQFWASKLQCAPHYQDWSTVGLLHVTGEAIVPSSQYDVQAVALACQNEEIGCADASTLLGIRTTRWGDVAAPFNPPDPSVQPAFSDIGALVDKFKSVPGAPIKARALLMGVDARGDINITPDVGFTHIAGCVDGFKGLPYPHKPGKCGGAGGACASDADCTGGNSPPCTLCP